MDVNSIPLLYTHLSKKPVQLIGAALRLLAECFARAGVRAQYMHLESSKAFWLHIYRPKKRHKTLREVSVKAFITVIKCILILSFAAVPATCISLAWYYGLHLRSIHFDKELNEVITASWFQVFGVMYALLAGVAVNWVAHEYKEMRLAVKRRDIERFLLLKDEDLSPLMHSMVAVIAFALLFGFMGLKYSSALNGFLIVGGSSYVFSLLCIVVRELDDPCGGLWFIRGIPSEWLETDAKKWRLQHFKVAPLNTGTETST